MMFYTTNTMHFRWVHSPPQKGFPFHFYMSVHYRHLQCKHEQTCYRR